MKIIAVTQARINSTRLPGKVMMRVGDQSLLEIHINNIAGSGMINKLILATTDTNADDPVAALAAQKKWEYFRGSETDVLDRFYQAVITDQPDYVVRLTADCPLIDAGLIDAIINYTIQEQLDYGSNTLKPSFPDGQDIEVFRYSALQMAWNNATLLSDREHVTPYIWKNSTYKGGELFVSGNFNNSAGDFSGVRMTVDEKEDFDVIKLAIENIGMGKSWNMYSDFILENENVRNINNHIVRNEGYIKSLNKNEQDQ